MTMPRRLLLGSLLGLLAVSSFWCSSSKSNQPDSSSVKITAATGGTIQVNGAALNIPAGALPADTTITVAKSTDPTPSGYASNSPLYVLSPSGLTFLMPVDMTLDFTGSSAGLAVFLTKVGGVGYDQLVGTVNGSTITAKIAHFSNVFAGLGIADGGMNSSDSIPLDGLAEAYLAVTCAQAHVCHQYDSVAGCMDVYHGYTGDLGSQIANAIDAGRKSYDGAAAKRCFDAVAASTECFDNSENGSSPLDGNTDCQNALKGLVPTLGNCFENDDCVAGNSCDTSSMCPGRCLARRGANQMLDAGEQCDKTLYEFNGKCVAPAAVGSGCGPAEGSSYPNQHCVSGSYCDQMTHLCAARVAAGQTCGQAGGQCVAGLNCMAIASDGGMACGQTPGLGAACNLSKGNYCAYDLRCDAATYEADGTCVARASLGGPCVNDNPGYNSYCRPGFYCDSAVRDAGTCAAPKAAGSSCDLQSQQGADCQPDTFCNTDGGLCTPKLPLGSDCDPEHKEACAAPNGCDYQTHKCAPPRGCYAP